MSLSLDITFVLRLAPQLLRFHQTKAHHWQCRCPFCGDSKKSEHKTRGGFFPSDDRTKLLFHCFNCGVATTLEKVIAHVDFALSRDYKLAKLNEIGGSRNHAPLLEDDKVNNTGLPTGTIDLFSGLFLCSDLPETHNAVNYLKSRCVPPQRYEHIFYTDNFSKWSNQYESLHGSRLRDVDRDPRLVFPLVTDSGIQFGYQARALEKSSPRYQTIMVDGRFSKCYGMDLMNRFKPIWVVEGIFDSFFLPNAIAALDADLSSVIKRLRLDPTNCIVLHDNEPRNRYITRFMHRSIEAGCHVAFWPPDAIFEGKDLNELIVNGRTDIVSELKVLQGMKARIEFSQWKRV